MRIFWRNGYAATSVEDLTEALDISRSSLYDTFGDKRTLFLEALAYYSGRVLSATQQTLAAASSPLAGIQMLFDDLIAGIGREGAPPGCLMVNSIAELVPQDREVTQIAEAYMEALQQLLTNRLTEAGRQGAVTRQQPPENLAAYVVNTIQGLRILIKAGATREQVEVIKEVTINSLRA